LDKNGAFVTTEGYYKANNFSEGVTAVQKQPFEPFFYLDKKGKKLFSDK
jgi:hypothetical protein